MISIIPNSTFNYLDQDCETVLRNPSTMGHNGHYIFMEKIPLKINDYLELDLEYHDG